MAKQKACYLCGHTHFSQRPGAVRDNPALTVDVCLACGLVSLSSFDHIGDQFYEDSRMHDSGPMDIPQWLHVTKADDERRFHFLKGQLKDRCWLDFGCGNGGLLLKAKNIAAKAHGVELESRLEEHFRKHDLTVFPGLDKVPTEHRLSGYDFITLFHVLEHLTDPRGMLSELSQMLTKKGEIIVEVPSSEDALLTLYNNEAFSRFTYWSCHLFYFSPQTLEVLASQAGLKVNYIKQVQRYPLSNHLHWLAKGKPGGHEHWSFLDTQQLNEAYEQSLAALGKCDTIIGSFSR